MALIERTDFAAGTSSRSSKLIHGGVRYLQQGDVSLVREVANERIALRHIAPHLAVPLTMVMPTYGRGMHMKLGVGLWTFEKLTTVQDGERYQTWDHDEALAHEPSLRGDGLFGAVAFVEYLTDDARLVLANIKAAHRAGALCVNHAEAVALRPGVTTVRDTLSGAERSTAVRLPCTCGTTTFRRRTPSTRACAR